MEKGTVDFFFKPKIGLKTATSMAEVQRFHMLLRPEEVNGKVAPVKAPFKARLLIFGAKSMPATHGRSTGELLHWAFVHKVDDVDLIVKNHLESREYETKTKGHREQQGAQPAGHGLYEFVHLHKPGRPKKRGPGTTKSREECVFAYVLEVPQQPGPVQAAFHIHKEAAYYCRVKNPQIATSVSRRTGAKVGLRSSAAHPDRLFYPWKLQQQFAGVRVHQTKFCPLVPAPDFLDFERSEILMIALTEDIKTKLGEIGQELEEEEAALEKLDEHIYGKGHMEDRIYEDLHLDPSTHPADAVKSHGSWAASKSTSAKASATKPAKTTKDAKSAKQASKVISPHASKVASPHESKLAEAS